MNKFDSTLEHLRDRKVEAIFEGKKVVGYLWFAGINDLHGHYQVTLDRTPYWPIDPKTIKLYEYR